MPWRRKWQTAPVFLLEKFHGQGSLVGYSPWGCKELDMTGQHTHSGILVLKDRESLVNNFGELNFETATTTKYD